jgi:hypothetical protein
VNYSVKGYAVNQNQVIPGSTAAHGEAGELAIGDQSRHAVQRSHDVTPCAHGAAQFLPVQQRVAHRPMRVGNPPAAGSHYDFLHRLRAGEHLEVERSHPAANYTYAGFVDCHQTRATCRDRIEPGVKVTQFDSAIGLGTTGDDVAVAVGRGNGHALDRPPCLHADDCNAHPAIRILRHRGKWSADGQHSCENLHGPFHADLLIRTALPPSSDILPLPLPLSAQ